ncbi:MAG: hypothetical protein MJ016_00465 [Victivallaceae bacterium]|nr:hypothetical protein [Victivallaceae bacterium]
MAFTTNKSLLARVRAGDEISWREFYDAYKPLIYLCGGDCGLTQDEKEELVLQVMAEIFRKDIVGKYDPEHIPEHLSFQYTPEKGRFRHFLRKIIRNQAIRIYHRRKSHLPLDAETASDELPSSDEWGNIWETQWRKHVMAMAMTELKTKVRPETYIAFEMYAVQNRPVNEVADFLNLSLSSVYTAKSRCIATLKEIIAKLEEQE